MSLRFTSEQEELRTLVRKFFSEQITPAYLRNRMESGAKTDPELWKKFCELGMFTYFSEDAAQGGKLIHDLGIVAFEAGRVLCPENIIDALLAGPVLLPRLSEKERETVLGAAAKKGEFESLPRGAIAVLGGSSAKPVLSGKAGKDAAVNGRVGPVAGVFSSAYVVLCPFDAEGPARQAASAEIDGSWEKTDLLDLTVNAGSKTFRGASAHALRGADSGWLAHCWCTLRANELAGIAAVCVEMTAEYVKTRKQFGVPVGAFQAVQHKLADAHLKAEALRSLAVFAAWAAHAAPEQFPLAARSALWFGRRAAGEVVESAIQLHGGIGFTWEFDLHLYLRRAKSIEAMTSFLTEEDFSEAMLELAN